MDKLPKVITKLVFEVMFFMALMSKVLATEGDILLSDDFNDKNLDGWTIEYGNWYVNPQGNLAGSNSGKMLGGKINTGNSEWDNYRIDLDINGFQGIDGGVGFRYTPNGNSYQLDLKFDINSSYFPGDPEAILRKTEDGTTTILGDTHSITLQGQTWYHLTIEVSNENIKIWIHNDLIFDITDIETRVKKGTLALNYWTGDIGVAYMKFDNVIITALAPPPPPKLPVIFIPGIGGSEFKASENIFWVDRDDGHGGRFSQAYSKDEKIWVNQDKAAELGDDDYFDVLRLKADGQTPEVALSLTGDLTSFGYSDIDSFFTGMGYEKGKNFFIFPYDWRKDVRTTKDSLDTLVEEAKTKSGQTKVNIVVHSMGGLVARYYISDTGKAVKVNKLIELGVPHLGSVDSLKTIIYGTWFAKDFYLFKLGIVPSEVFDVTQNLPSVFQLLPSKAYYDFYTNSHESLPYPFFDERDIDNDKVTGPLNFNQIKNLLTNLGHNMPVFNLGEQFHDFITPLYNQNNGVKIYIIGGTGSDTLGQIHETWLIKWPIKLVPITDEIKIDGDETVPIYSAIPRNNFKDLTGATKVYYVVQEHADMPRAAGISMQTVKAILNEDSLPVEVKDQKIELEGKQVSVFEGELDLYDDSGNHTGLNDKGEIETNIPDISFSAPQNSRHAFIKKSAKKIKIKITSKKKNKINAKIRYYTKDKVEKTTLYKDIPITETAKVEFSLDATTDTSSILALFPDSTKADSTNISSTSEVSGPSALDQTPPTSKIDLSGTKDSSGKFTSDATVTLTGSDADSGILRIEYSLDNGQTVQIYSEPFTISISGKTTLQVKSIDKLGNEEIPQEVVIEVALSNSNSSDSSSSSDNNSSLSSAADTSEVKSSDTSEVDKSEAKQAVLGISTAEDNPSVSTDSELQTNNFKIDSVLSGLLIVSGGIVILASLGLAFTFLKPTPK